MAGDPRFTRLLLGMGLREFSMQPGALLDIKEILLDSDVGALARRAERLFAQIDELDSSDLLSAFESV
jgi:Phosphoenolpyruvate-protein kinase (PTS system EI component in bacteria)